MRTKFHGNQFRQSSDISLLPQQFEKLSVSISGVSTHTVQRPQASVFPQKKKYSWLSDKPCMHYFFHFLVNDKIVAS
jgi:hypothetical protein